jgi:hypothetical protein
MIEDSISKQVHIPGTPYSVVVSTSKSLLTNSFSEFGERLGYDKSNLETSFRNKVEFTFDNVDPSANYHLDYMVKALFWTGEKINDLTGKSRKGFSTSSGWVVPVTPDKIALSVTPQNIAVNLEKNLKHKGIREGISNKSFDELIADQKVEAFRTVVELAAYHEFTHVIEHLNNFSRTRILYLLGNMIVYSGVTSAFFTMDVVRGMGDRDFMVLPAAGTGLLSIISALGGVYSILLSENSADENMLRFNPDTFQHRPFEFSTKLSY